MVLTMPHFNCEGTTLDNIMCKGKATCFTFIHGIDDWLSTYKMVYLCSKHVNNYSDCMIFPIKKDHIYVKKENKCKETRIEEKV